MCNKNLVTINVSSRLITSAILALFALMANSYGQDVIQSREKEASRCNIAMSRRERDSDKKEIASKGIKTITERQYSFKENFSKYAKERSSIDVFLCNGAVDAIAYAEKYEYDKRGNLIKTSYLSDGINTNGPTSPDAGSCYPYYTYDKSDNPVGITFYIEGLNANGRDVGVDGKGVFKCDENGNVIEYTSYYGDGYGVAGTIIIKDIYSYDEKGNISNIEYYSGDGNLKNKITYKHDDNSKIIEYTTYDDRGFLTGQGIFKYDSNGNRIELDVPNELGSNKPDNLKVAKTYKYDDKGNLIETRDSSGLTTFKYDSNGNIIEKTFCITQSKFGKEEKVPQKSWEYEYTFYEGNERKDAPAKSENQEELTGNTKNADSAEAQKQFNDAYKLHQEKRYEDAIKIFKEIYVKYPKENFGYTSAYNIACGYSLLGKKDEAMEWLQKSIDAGFKDFEHMAEDTDLANIRDDPRYRKLIGKGDGNTVNNSSDNGIEKGLSAQQYFDKAEEFWQKQDWANAIRYYSKAIEKRSDWAIVYSNRGMAKYKMGDYESAMYDFDAARKLDPGRKKECGNMIDKCKQKLSEK